MARIRKSQPPIAAASKELIWYVAIYIRLSKEDGKDESLSVTNQRKIIQEYLEQFFTGEYVIVDHYIDDGLTGTDFDRPGFQRMLYDMDKGRINCIVCKNLSRMFRNYSDQGYFLEKVFPMNRTRFITVSDPKVDSYLRPESVEGLEVPINGLMNDRYAAKTSHDIRDTFATKRRKGEFIGAFAPYGYAKDPEDKNSLIIDAEAARVVQDIFKWFVYEGFSKNGIARRLNQLGILNPAAYKQSKGFKYNNPQTGKNDGHWCTSTITGILKNQMYIGTMVQGRQTVISYKVHKKIAVPEDRWYRVEGTHQPIIDPDLFSMAQSLQQRDTRTAPAKGELHLFAGFIRCADCKKAMTRQKTKNIVYYYCRTYRDKSKSLCTKHSVREETLTDILLAVIQKQIQLAADVGEIMEAIHNAPVVEEQSVRLGEMLRISQKELDKTTNAMDSLYWDWKNGDISHDEYIRLKSKYKAQEHRLKQTIDHFQTEYDAAAKGCIREAPYLLAFMSNKNITSLKRCIVVNLVNNIYVHNGGKIEIELKFSDPFQAL